MPNWREVAINGHKPTTCISLRALPGKDVCSDVFPTKTVVWSGQALGVRNKFPGQYEQFPRSQWAFKYVPYSVMSFLGCSFMILSILSIVHKSIVERKIRRAPIDAGIIAMASTSHATRAVLGRRSRLRPGHNPYPPERSNSLGPSLAALGADWVSHVTVNAAKASWESYELALGC